ncbi:MAG: glycosyltransferase [Bacillota bacterium]
MKTQKLTAMLLVRNEADRYLKEVLDDLDQYVDEIVIVDDASTDETPQICESYGRAKVIRRNEPGFSNEYVLRKFCWEETIKTNPDWILALDADELFEDRMKSEIRNLLNSEDVDAWSFRLYDFWGSKHSYRDDAYWGTHRCYWPYLLRNLPISPVWKETPIHCGRIPQNILTQYRIGYSDIRIKHYGWVNKADHKIKFDRYIKGDPDGRYNNYNLQQYYSIFDENPNLVKWEE